MRAGNDVYNADSPGGSGTFYYVAAAPGDGRGANAIALGDRIRPQSISIEQGKIAVRHLDRPQQVPMTATPSVTGVCHFTVINGHLSESH